MISIVVIAFIYPKRTFLIPFAILVNIQATELKIRWMIVLAKYIIPSPPLRNITSMILVITVPMNFQIKTKIRMKMNAVVRKETPSEIACMVEEVIQELV